MEIIKKIHGIIFCVLAILITVVSLANSELETRKTFRKLPQYKDKKPAGDPSKELTVSSQVHCVTECSSYFGCKGFIYNSGNSMCYLYNEPLTFSFFVSETNTEYYESVPSDCVEIIMNGDKTSGVYTIVPRDNGSPIRAYCEISDNDSGWLVFQRRTDGSEDFYRTWQEYRDGFGSLTNEFWLGNENIHRLTRQGYYDLKIDLEDFEGNTTFAIYKNFSVTGEDDFYRLSVEKYRGNAGDALINTVTDNVRHNGMRFSTKDNDNSCASNHKGGWWYNSCHSANLNGLYLNGTNNLFGVGINWSPWRGYYYSLKKTVMKICPSSVLN